MTQALQAYRPKLGERTRIGIPLDKIYSVKYHYHQNSEGRVRKTICNKEVQGTCTLCDIGERSVLRMTIPIVEYGYHDEAHVKYWEYGAQTHVRLLLVKTTVPQDYYVTCRHEQYKNFEIIGLGISSYETHPRRGAIYRELLELDRHLPLRSATTALEWNRPITRIEMITRPELEIIDHTQTSPPTSKLGRLLGD